MTIIAVLVLGAVPQVRSGPLSPEDALRTFKLADGLSIELVAAEPHTTDPVCLAFDEAGVMYVAEMGDYPLGPPSGRVRRLVDTDGDGRVDRSTVFTDNLPFPTGVMPWKGGVLVTAAPDVLFFKDTDGDGRADLREVVLTGFRRGNQQHNVNGLVYGLDNWIYGANGDSGGVIHAPGKPDAKPVAIHGMDFRFRPDTGEVEGVSGQSQFANTFDEWGRRFINNNSNHIRHPVVDLRYLRRNPHLAIPSIIDEISDHGAGSRIHPVSRLEARFNDLHTANHFTSACAVTVYTGDALGDAYRGNAFVCEPVHNLVHRDLLSPRGASFTAKRGEENAEFLASTDNWFRPVNLATGPDGALYVVDMYRAVIEHPQWIPLDVQKRVDLRAGHDRGRIYRITVKGSVVSRKPPHIDSPNGWARTTAQRLTVERQDKSAVGPLREMAASSKSPLARLHALWTLEGLGALEDGQIHAASRDPNPCLREQALRLSEPRLVSAMAHLAEDADPRVRFQAALTFAGMDEALLKILARDGADRWTRLAVLTSVRDPVNLLGTNVDLVRSLAGIVAARRDEKELIEWFRAVTKDNAATPAPWQLAAMTLKGVDIGPLLAKSGADKVVAMWSANSEGLAADPSRDVAERVAAVELLAGLRSASVLEKLLRPQEPQEVQIAVVRALSESAGARLLDGWTSRTAAVRREILSTMLAKPERVALVLDRIESGDVRVVELEPHQRNLLLQHKSSTVRERAKKALDAAVSNDRAQVVEEVGAKVFALKGDLLKGEKVYVSNCSACHRLHGQGVRVGPGLETVAGRDKRALLADLLDPNRAVDPAFQVFIVKAAAGEFSGVIAAEAPHSVTLRRQGGEETAILRKDIVSMKAWPASMMPDGIENNVTPQEFADLLEFLRGGVSGTARKVFEGNAPELVKPGADGAFVLSASQSEIYGGTIVFESKHKNLGYWSGESDRGVWQVEVAKAGKYAVELEWACEEKAAGNAFVMEAGDSRLAGRVPGTGTWDTYRRQKFGAVELKGGKQQILFRSEGKIAGALIDLKTIRLIPE